tara:strand:- start:213 stop:611 length:399 start_codon:yes stop_codon:yes gene_type:complete
MIFRLSRLCLFLISFLFLTGFVPLSPILGPALTVVSSGNFVKATAQLAFDREFKKKTGKNSLSYIKDEVSKNNYKNDINKDLKNLVEKRIKIVHKKLVEQNNEKKLNKNFKLLVEKRVKLTHKKIELQKINQ